MGQGISFIRALISHRYNIKSLVNDVTFLPPCPCQYLVSDVSGKYVGKIFHGGKMITIPDNVNIHFLPIHGDRCVCVFHITSASSKAALIYSHGNAADCGSMLPRCALLAEKLNVDVYLYDYEGYGYSTGVHCDETIRIDIEQVFELVLKSFNSNRIFLYGESIGSVPTLYLAAKVSQMKEKQFETMYYKDDGSFSNSNDQVIPDSDNSLTECSSEDSDFSIDTDDGYVMMEDNREFISDTSQLNDSVYTSLLSYPAVTLPLKRSQSQPVVIKTRPKKRPQSSIKLAGVILHSALLSGRRTVFNCDLFKSCDPFDNSVTATQVECPVFHIHGTKDPIIPFSSGVKLYEYTGSAYQPWWVFDGHHNDIVTAHEEEYYQRMNAFITYCFQRFQ